MQGHVPSLQVWAITQVVANALIWPMIQQCVLNQSQRHGLFFMSFLPPYHLYVNSKQLFGTWCNWNPWFWWRASIFLTKHAKTSLKPFPFIYGDFLKGQSSQHVGIDVEPPLQRLEVHSTCWQGKSPTNCKWVWPSSIVSIPCLCIQFFQSKWCRCPSS